jgi:acylphosphatase
VQGVGFRYWAHHTAERLPGVSGLVRNLPDGTVEVEAEAAERGSLDALFHELHVGPTHAQVTAVDAQWEENVPPRYASGFRVA